MNVKTQPQPQNIDSFNKLQKFGKEVGVLCGKLGIKPILYGSMAYYYHTNDKSVLIRDLDFLIPEESFPELMKLLEKEKLLTVKMMPYHSIEIFKDELEINLDSMEHFLGKRSKKCHKIIMEGSEFFVLNINSLLSIYEEALKNMPKMKKLDAKRRKYSLKLRKLKSV